MGTVSNLVPTGTNIASNSSPTISPINGSLALDSTLAGILYIGNGTTFSPVALNETSDSTLSAITLTSAGSNPSLTATVYLQKTISSSFAFVKFEMDINTSITAVGPDTWNSSAGAISAAFRPANTCNFPMYITVNGAYETANSILTISSAGTISVINNFSYTSTTVAFTNCNGNFKH